MKNFYYMVWLISYILCSGAVKGVRSSRYNITYAQLDSCDIYHIENKYGYLYTDFFTVDKLDNNNLKADERLHLKFYVLTSMDAHILLSVTNAPRQNDRVYEIVIGAGGNSFSAIRTNMGKSLTVTNSERGLLSIYDPTPIEIVQTKEGNLRVYIPGFRKEPLLNFLDFSPLTINYISFSTFGKNDARWFYDCAFDGFSREMEKEKRQLTEDQQLMQMLAENAKNGSVPNDLSALNFSFQVRSLAYESASILLRTRIQLILSWQDARLSWEPKNFHDKQIIFGNKDLLPIWKPQLLVLNGALESLGDVLQAYELRITANGTVMLLASNLELITWCVDTERNWPNERIDCEIKLGIRDEEIRLIHDQQMPLPRSEHVNTLSAWTFVKIAIANVINTTNLRYSKSGSLQTTTGDVAIQFTLQRNSAFYNQVFFMPLFACQIFILLSLMLRGYRRGGLILLVVVLTATSLMFITKHATPHYVPPLMLANQYMLYIAVYAYMLHVAIMWLELYPPRSRPSGFLMGLVSFSPLRLVLCLRFVDGDEYCLMQDRPWLQLAKLANNMSFIGISACFVALNTMLY